MQLPKRMNGNGSNSVGEFQEHLYITTATSLFPRIEKAREICRVCKPCFFKETRLHNTKTTWGVCIDPICVHPSSTFTEGKRLCLIQD